MKKLILLVLAIVGSFCGHSQDEPSYPRNQISVFYGGISPLFIVNLPNNGPEKLITRARQSKKKTFIRKYVTTTVFSTCNICAQ